MWDRRTLKEKAKSSFRNNYWAAVLAALVLALVAEGTGLSGRSTVSNYRQMNNMNSILNDRGYEGIQGFDSYYDGYSEDLLIRNPIIDEFRDLDNFGGFGADDSDLGMLFVVLFRILIVSSLIFLIIFFIIKAFLLSPFEVGCRKFFINNSLENANTGDIVSSFSPQYMNIVKGCFFKDLYIFLWTMLFVIPGIIKSYEYRMVPYVLADNPDMDRKEALAASSKMMYGNKLDTFVLDLSFIGWRLLSVATLGILGIFYVDPYIAQTNAELYIALSEEDERKYGYAQDNYNDESDVYISFEQYDDTSTYD